MSKKVDVKVNYKGVGQLLKSNELSMGLANLATQIEARCGEGYEHEVKEMGTRVIASVYTATPKAMASNMKHNTLLKAVKG